MRFMNCLGFLVMLLIQSEIILSSFVCNDQSKPKDKQGFCGRRRYESDKQDTGLPPENGRPYLTIRAARDKDNNWTCRNLRIGDKLLEDTWCCNAIPTNNVEPATYEHIHSICYGRGHVGRDNRGAGPHPPRSILKL
ncbi:hypothetical protein MJO28_013308 [Puccinia striiformis f. sp. tritici]|uniref:Secreted protein n=4 Tax=Puccinia striiformis TaxID=27350 RepID=A0A0L0VZ73_9BASI|nr:hypothetical protein Pst134EA_024233 [Puccinia striiformis f. sp. tritici]KAI9606695.1 hypothetical protein H4Q26_006232 [Puccinia striiformis f. sp. tritici PST-130]KNF04576.1 hypothetical protein PSTG_02486 [Puccinia striiformis f. sp. tritici PST-78]POV97382.1 hypothetical protein PSHT_14615 [Puccinia striiformis]KAH9444658.1 hypothetical protein Pst134EB_024916 [Puccinia striiformis f. sp. tritici]KAH9444669.1 hypothetical protein Pst134EB_024926 [Puccinia striiformis f. sp. tritici]